jgi:hypothetical protein
LLVNDTSLLSNYIGTFGKQFILVVDVYGQHVYGHEGEPDGRDGEDVNVLELLHDDVRDAEAESVDKRQTKPNQRPQEAAISSD